MGRGKYSRVRAALLSKDPVVPWDCTKWLKYYWFWSQALLRGLEPSKACVYETVTLVYFFPQEILICLNKSNIKIKEDTRSV